ncbi:hypothetical protein QYE76_067668 [Lolium multiflorum]|uniref:RRM domain-containing protein n=1 Tax=Lolium multiflorum TaxID=4521 RepID=A0AAD8WB65_LOLMU|nr:hypothetical protein QYE76_067668 [Lolium multiflorum]
MVGGGGAGIASDGTEGGAVALEDGGGARPMRLTCLVFNLGCGAPLGPAAFVFILPPFLAAGGAAAEGAAAGGAAAGEGPSKNCFGNLFLFDGMVAEIMADTSPALGGPTTGTSTTAAVGDGPPAYDGPCGGSMAAGSGRDVAGKGGAEEIERRRRRLGFAETVRTQWKGGYWFRPLFPLPPRAIWEEDMITAHHCHEVTGGEAAVQVLVVVVAMEAMLGISLLVFWPDDLRRPFGKFGRVKDVYLPRDYHTQEPRGFGFIQYCDPEDAADAKYYMDGQVLLGREITVVFAEENRKKPDEMRVRERTSSRGRSYDRRSRSPRRGRSRSPGYSGRSRSPSRSYSPAPKRKRYSRSPAHRERSVSRSPVDRKSRSGSPSEDRGSRSPRRQRSPSVSQ